MQLQYMKRSNWTADAITIHEEIYLVGRCNYNNSTVDDEVEILKRYLKISGIQLGLAGMLSQQCDVGLVGKYRR